MQSILLLRNHCKHGLADVDSSSVDAVDRPLSTDDGQGDVTDVALVQPTCEMASGVPMQRPRERNGGHIKVSRSFIEKVQFQLDRTVRFAEMMQKVLDQQEQPQKNLHLIDNSDSVV